jgi:hypothetical protein
MAWKYDAISSAVGHGSRIFDDESVGSEERAVEIAEDGKTDVSNGAAE